MGISCGKVCVFFLVIRYILYSIVHMLYNFLIILRKMFSKRMSETLIFSRKKNFVNDL